MTETCFDTEENLSKVLRGRQQIMGQIVFDDVAEAAGISYAGTSYGASWGDFNNDNLPDLWVTNHSNIATLYLNEGNGQFTNITSEVFPEISQRDRHGAEWIDFDNDGDLDLVQLVGGGSGQGSLNNPNLANEFFVNEEGRLTDRAKEFGLDYTGSRGRSPLLFDYDNDGLLDLFAGGENRPDGLLPSTIFRQTEAGFVDVRETVDFNLTASRFGLLSNLSDDRDLELVLLDFDQGIRVYDVASIPFEDITSSLLPNGFGAQDIISGDFNGDLLSDLYVTRQGLDNSGWQQVTPENIRVNLQVQAQEKGAKFKTTGDVTFNLSIFGFGLGDLTPNDIYIGSEGFHPTDFQFTLSPNEAEGILPFNPGIDEGIYLGYDSDLQEWQLSLSSPNHDLLTGIIESTESIDNLSAIGFNNDRPIEPDLLLINNGQELENRSDEAGINSLDIPGKSVVSGDFDNDMDLDLYIVATNTAGNIPNILYENQGDGTFIPLPDAGGAAGTTSLGIGDSATTADYNLDGFLDLFVTNGDWPPLLDDGPYQLFQNQGNDNHWLEIDLEGVVSNRDGIGAQIFLTAGGVTQLREQSGGIHDKSQNHQRIHFGLAENATIEELVVEWPSGIVQTIEDIPADQLIQIIEPSGSFSPGKPIFTPGSESGVFLWKDTFDGPYHLRTVGSEIATEFEVNLITTDGALEVIPFDLETNDELELTDFGFSFNSKLFGSQDGIDFRLDPGAEALLSVKQDGIANPRQVNIGRERSRLSPNGWILSADEFPVRPSFNAGEDLGLFVGQGTNPDLLEFRGNGDGNNHLSDLFVIASEETVDFTPVDLERNDEITTLTNGINITGQVGSWWDGVDVTITDNAQIGFTYKQDGLNQAERVNPYDNILGLQNAYSIPLAMPYGQPEYDISSDEGLFLWKDEEELWHLRATGGEEGSLYVGSLISNNAPLLVDNIEIENEDTVDLTNPSRIDFELRVDRGFQDGIDFRFPEGSSLSFNLESPDNGAQLVRIGSEQWAVSSLPLDLSDWV